MRLFVSHRPDKARPAQGQPARRGQPVKPEALTRAAEQLQAAKAEAKVPEINGPSGPEPTRYGDWERNGICSDF